MALPTAITLNAVQGGSNPSPVLLVISNEGAGTLPWSVQSGASSWISVSQSSGTTPSPVTLSFNTSGLAAGTISGQVTFVSGTSTQTVNVQLTLAASQPASFVVQPQLAYFVAVSGAAAAGPSSTQTLTVSNPGSGAVTWTAAATAPWITISPSSGTTPAQVVVTIDSSGLAGGSNSGAINFQASGGSSSFTAQVNVLVQVNPAQAHLLLSPRLLTFSGVAGATLTPQSTQVSTDQPVTATFTAGDASNPTWLTLNPTAGSVPGTVSASVNAAGMPAGLTVASPPVSLSTGQFDRVSVILSLANATDRPSLLLTDGERLLGGILLVAPAGGSAVTKSFTVQSNNGAAFAWNAMGSGANWLSVSPASGSAAGAVTVSANPAGLPAGVYQGQVAVTSANTVQPSQLIGVTLLVTASHSMVAESVDVAAAAASGVLAATQPAGQFQATVSYPQTLRASLVDANGNALSGSNVSVLVSGNPNPIVLTDTGSGVYEGIWTPLTSGDVVLTFTSTGAANSDFRAGTIVAGSQTLPVLFARGAVNAANFRSDEPLVAGSLVSLFGSNLAASAANATTLPLLVSLANVSLKVNSTAVPLLYASSGQINFQVPWEVAGQTSALLQITAGGQVALLGGVPVGSVGPGIFVASGTQGAVIHQNGSLTNASSPATVGEIISIYATGLGAVTNPPATGAAAGSSSTTSLQPVVTINGISATVNFSGLAPGFVGLYQVNVTVPAGSSGSGVPVTLSIGGVSSNTVTIAVK